MTSVKAPLNTRVQKQTSNRYMLLAVKILLVLIILLLLPKLVDGRTRPNRYKKRRRAEVLLQDTRRQCEMEACIRFLPEEAMNCVQLCISPNCYERVYGGNPLEDGELDIDRAQQFELCVKEEMKEARKRQRQNPELFGEEK